MLSEGYPCSIIHVHNHRYAMRLMPNFFLISCVKMTIYKLVEPQNQEEIRYVGRTGHHARRRAEHAHEFPQETSGTLGKKASLQTSHQELLLKMELQSYSRVQSSKV